MASDGGASGMQLVERGSGNASGSGGGLGHLMKKNNSTVVAAGSIGGNAIVEYREGSSVVLKEEQEDIEVKLRRIIDHVPVRVSNTSGSSAGSGSGDFHQYRQMRRKEQDRVTRMDKDYKKRKSIAEFELRREQRLKAEEERTAKKRVKRQKKKQKKKEKKSKTSNDGEGLLVKENSSDDNNENDPDVVNE